MMEKAAADSNRAGEAFHAAGIKFGYHPHGYEFVANGTAGETLLDDLIRSTKPENVCYEMDVFWVLHGGANPVKLMEKYPSRWVALHVKDLRKGAPILLPKPESAPDTDNVAVGGGEIDWKSVIGTAEKIGVTYYFIEDETPAPLENIPASLAYLKALKL
jgi:sugar phosphate isomerase/epimerase